MEARHMMGGSKVHEPPTELRANVRKEALGQGIGNVFANGLIAWLLLKERESLSLWSLDGVALDVTLTCLLLPLIVSWIVIATQKSKLARAKLASLKANPDNGLHRLLLKAPRRTAWAASCFGAFGVIAVAPLTLLGFQLLSVHVIAATDYMVFKALWTGAMAALIAILGVHVALLRPPEVARNDGS